MLVKDRTAAEFVPMRLNFMKSSATTGGGRGLAGFAKQKARSGTDKTRINVTPRFGLRAKMALVANFIDIVSVPNVQSSGTRDQMR